MNFNTFKNKVLKWLKNLKKVFKTILKGNLLLNCKEVNYKIMLKTKKIKLLPLIFIRLEKQ